MVLFFLNEPRILVESAFHIAKEGGGELIGNVKDVMGHETQRDSMNRRTKTKVFGDKSLWSQCEVAQQ